MSVDKKLPDSPASSLKDMQLSGHASWQAFEIMAEFVSATERLKEITPAVSVFGSARIKPGTPYYTLTEKFLACCRTLVSVSFPVVAPGLWKLQIKGHLPEPHLV